jgi:hypothetical protein
VHHGNGTEDIIMTAKEFQDNILFISTHCCEIYPHSGTTSPGTLKFVSFSLRIEVEFYSLLNRISLVQLGDEKLQISLTFLSNCELMDSSFGQNFGTLIC